MTDDQIKDAHTREKLLALIDADLAVCEKATPGPWIVTLTILSRGLQKGKERLAGIFHRKSEQRICATNVISPNYTTYEGDVWETWLSCKPEDWELIAAARTGWEASLRAIREEVDRHHRRFPRMDGSSYGPCRECHSQTPCPTLQRLSAPWRDRL